MERLSNVQLINQNSILSCYTSVDSLCSPHAMLSNPRIHGKRSRCFLIYVVLYRTAYICHGRGWVIWDFRKGVWFDEGDWSTRKCNNTYSKTPSVCIISVMAQSSNPSLKPVNIGPRYMDRIYITAHVAHAYTAISNPFFLSPWLGTLIFAIHAPLNKKSTTRKWGYPTNTNPSHIHPRQAHVNPLPCSWFPIVTPPPPPLL